MNPLSVLSRDHKQIIYRPELRPITGSVTATILLQQIIFRFYANGCKPFYKFTAPCGNKAYKDGDSWCEELGFSKAELSKARAKIAFKSSKGTPKDMNSLVWFWTDIQRLTWYEININALRKALNEIYVNQQSAFTVNQQSAFTKTNKVDLDNTETTNKDNYKDYSHTKRVSGDKKNSFSFNPSSPIKDAEKRVAAKKVAAKKAVFTTPLQAGRAAVAHFATNPEIVAEYKKESGWNCTQSEFDKMIMELVGHYWTQPRLRKAIQSSPPQFSTGHLLTWMGNRAKKKSKQGFKNKGYVPQVNVVRL